METTTLNQLIQSGTVLMVSVIGIICWTIYSSKLRHYKKLIVKESNLLKDILFLRAMIEKYKEICRDEMDGPGHRRIMEKVKTEFGISLSEAAQPARVADRLRELDEMNQVLEVLVEHLRGQGLP